MQVRAEESLESNYTCLACLRPFNDPVVCVPCGHTYCRSCIQQTGATAAVGPDVQAQPHWCQECGGAPVRQLVPVANLESLASKFEFKLGALRDLQRLCAGLDITEEVDDVP
jgi:RING-type zinc-finger